MTTPTSTDPLASAYRQLLGALMEGDAGALRRLLAPDCIVVGPKGYRIDTDEWVQVHSDDVYQQILVESLDSQSVRHGGSADTAVRCDLQYSECLFQGEAISGLFRVLTVWVRRHPGWTLAAIQYTAVTPNVAKQE